jgi:hypothetical protein
LSSGGKSFEWRIGFWSSLPVSGGFGFVNNTLDCHQEGRAIVGKEVGWRIGLVNNTLDCHQVEVALEVS